MPIVFRTTWYPSFLITLTFYFTVVITYIFRSKYWNKAKITYVSFDEFKRNHFFSTLWWKHSNISIFVFQNVKYFVFAISMLLYMLFILIVFFVFHTDVLWLLIQMLNLLQRYSFLGSPLPWQK